MTPTTESSRPGSPTRDPDSPVDASVDAARTSNEAWGIVSRMLAGMLVYGLAGWAIGNWLGAPATGLAIGLLLGLGLGLYLSVVSLRRLGTSAPALPVSSSRSWSARMTRARIERAREE